MDLQRYVEARARVDEILRGLNLYDLAPGENLILRDKETGGVLVESTDLTNEIEAVEYQSLQEAQMRQRIRQIIKQGGLTAVLPTDPLSLYDQLAAEQRVYAPASFASEDMPQLPRFPGEEGIYVSPEADIPDFNLYKLTARLLREDPRMRIFFDSSGNLKLAPLLLGDPDVRLFGVGDEDFLPEDPRFAASLPQMRESTTSANNRIHRSLCIQIGSVTLRDHALFTREDVLCVRLRREIEQWVRRKAMDPIRAATGRIEMLKAQVEGELLRLNTLLPRLIRLRQRAASAMTTAAITATAVSSLVTSLTSSIVSVLGGKSGNEQQAGSTDSQTTAQEATGGSTTIQPDLSTMASLAASKASNLTQEELDLREECSRAIIQTAELLQMLIEARVQRDAAWATETRHFESIYTLWLQVRRLRLFAALENAKLGLFDPRVDPRVRDTIAAALESQRHLEEKDLAGLVYIGHPLVLKVRKVTPSPEQTQADADAWRADEVTELEELSNYNKLLRYARDLQLPVGETSHPPEDTFDANAALLKIRDRMARCRPTPGAPRYEPVLDTTSATAAVTPDDACNSAEVRRRQKLTSQSLVLVLHVNGHEILRSKPARISFPSYTVEFNLEAHLKVLRAPRSISCQILQMGYFGGSPLAEFTLITPSPIAPPFVQDPSFTWGKKFEADFPLAVDKATSDVVAELASGTAIVPKYTRETSGLVEAAVFWIIPPHRPLTPEELQDLDPMARNASRGRHAAAYRRSIAANSGGVSTMVGLTNASKLVGFDPEIASHDARASLSQIDPNDPRAAYEAVRRHDSQSAAVTAAAASVAQTGSGAAMADGATGPLGTGLNTLEGHEFAPELLLIDPHYHVPSLRKQLLTARSQSSKDGAAIPLREEDVPAEFYTVLDRSIYSQAGTSLALAYAGVHAPTDAAFTGPFKRGFVLPGQSYPPSVVSSFLVSEGQGGPTDAGLAEKPVHDFALGLPEPPSQYDLARAQLVLSREPRVDDTLPQVLSVSSGPRGKTATITDVSQVVREVVNPDFVLTSNFLQELFRTPRPLYTYRDISAPVVNPTSCRIIVQVIRAVNLPLRSTSHAAQSLAAGGSDTALFSGELADGAHTSDDARRQLNCVVQVSFQSSTRRTGPSSGTSPHWNEVLALPFTTPTEAYDPAGLLKLTESVRFSIFDKIEDSRPAHDPRLKSTNMQSSEMRLIGTAEIPFSAIYCNGSIEAGLDLELPLIHLGYERLARNLRQPTLHVYVTLDPLLLPPPPPPLPEAGELPRPFIPIAEWLRDVRSLPAVSGVDRRNRAIARATSGGGLGGGGADARQGLGYEPGPRTITALVMDVNAYPQLVCRYLTPQAPPVTAQTNPLAFSRFVASIPFARDEETHADGSLDSETENTQLQDVWCSSAQFLRLGQGDWEEHAILLANYYLWWDIQAGCAVYDPNSHAEICEAGSAPNESEAIAIIERSLAASGAVIRQGSRWGTYLAFVETVPDGSAIYVLRLHYVNGVLMEEVYINPVTGVHYPSSLRSGPSAAVSADHTVQSLPSAGTTDPPSTALAAASAAASTWVGSTSEVSVSPIRAISCIVSPTNVWANIQNATYIHETNLNLADPNLWRPLFTPRGATSGFSCSLAQYLRAGGSLRPLQGTIGQFHGLPYEPGPWVSLVDIETAWRGRAAGLERMIEAAFEQWRTMPTAWNLGVAKLFREYAMQRFEATAQARLESPAARRQLGLATTASTSTVAAAGAVVDRAFILRLRASFPGMHGFPMSFPVVADDESWQTGSAATNPILRRIRATLLHTTEDPEASFALAVHAHPYTSKFAVMWVFIAMLSKSDS